MYVLAFTGVGLSAAVYLLFGIAMVSVGAIALISSKRKRKSSDSDNSAN